MSLKSLLTFVAGLVCVGSVYAVVVQRQQLSQLLAERSTLTTQTETNATPSEEDGTITASPVAETSPELLRLRSEVTRLTARKRELAGVAEEGERLRAQLAAIQTNTAAASSLPQGYMRKSEAQMVGYSTPENAVQSLLWALAHQNLDAFLQSFTPEQAQHVQSRIQASSASGDSFLKESQAVPGIGIQGRQNLPDGSVELQVTFGPGMPPQSFRLQAINGEWKFADVGL